MIDIENTISNLETNIRWIESTECHQFPGWGNVTMAMRDALELLKEQEPVKPIFVENPYTHLPVSYCPQCREPIDQYVVGNPYKMTKFCHYCGKAVKWND